MSSNQLGNLPKSLLLDKSRYVKSGNFPDDNFENLIKPTEDNSNVDRTEKL
jgi:hypothetical protein